MSMIQQLKRNAFLFKKECEKETATELPEQPNSKTRLLWGGSIPRDEWGKGN